MICGCTKSCSGCGKRVEPNTLCFMCGDGPCCCKHFPANSAEQLKHDAQVKMGFGPECTQAKSWIVLQVDSPQLRYHAYEEAIREMEIRAKAHPDVRYVLMESVVCWKAVVTPPQIVSIPLIPSTEKQNG